MTQKILFRPRAAENWTVMLTCEHQLKHPNHNKQQEPQIDLLQCCKYHHTATRNLERSMHTCSNGSSTTMIRSSFENLKGCLGSFFARRSVKAKRSCFVTELCFHSSKAGNACAALETNWSKRNTSAEIWSNSVFRTCVRDSSLQT